MNSDDEYYVPVKVEDESLLFVFDKTTEFLKHNSHLESIFQKYNEAYNTTFKDSYSVKTLQVMNQNRKPIFSSITPSGRIKSPRCSSVSPKKDANQQLHTPLKRNRISLSTERKKLSFDDSGKKDTELPQAFTQTCDDSQLLVTSPNKKNRTPDRFIPDERNAIAYLDASPQLFSYGEEMNTSDSPNMCVPERFSLNGKPETITSLSIYEPDTDDSLFKTPDLEISLSFLNSVRKVKASDNSDAHIQEMFSLEKKPETIRSFASHDKDTPCPTTKTPDKQQTMVTSCEKNITPVNNTTDDRSVKHLVICPSLFKEEEQTKVSDKPKTNGQEYFHPDEKPKITPRLSTEHKEVKKPETSPILSIVDKEAISMSHKTPDKWKIRMFDRFNKKEGTSLNSIVAKRVIVETASNEYEFLSPMKDTKTPNNPKVNKRKSVDCSEDAVINARLVAEDQESVGRPKIAKLDDGLTEDDKKTIDPAYYSTVDDKDSFKRLDVSAMDDTNSFNRLDVSAMDDTNSFNPIDNSAMDSKVHLNLDDHSADDEKQSFNPVDDSVMDDKDSYNPVDNCAMDDEESFNHIDVIDEMSTVPSNTTDLNAMKSASQIEKSERTANVSAYYQTSETLTYDSHFSPKGDQKIKVEDNSDISSSKKDQIIINSNVTHETTDVESLTNFMENLSPSEKRSVDGSSQISTTNRSVSDDTSFARQLCLQDNLSKTATSPKNCLVSNVSSPKLDNIGMMTKIEIFCKKVIQSKKRLSNYRCLFLEDKDDLQFIYDYLRRMTAIVEIIPIKVYNAELTENVQVFADKASKLLDKAISWQFGVEYDLVVCDDCLKKTSEIQQEIQRICENKTHDLTPNNFRKWEACLRVKNKKADDMILLRDIRRPTILQFGHELENLIQLLIRCLIVLGLIKPSSKVSSD